MGAVSHPSGARKSQTGAVRSDEIIREIPVNVKGHVRHRHGTRVIRGTCDSPCDRDDPRRCTRLIALGFDIRGESG